MTAAQHTPGPWRVGDREPYVEVWGPRGMHGSPIIASMENEPRDENARLIAASPDMADAIKGLIGLCQMIRNRDDCPAEIRQALTHNHRIIAGYEAISKAGIEGFQPSDFDAHKPPAVRP